MNKQPETTPLEGMDITEKNVLLSLEAETYQEVIQQLGSRLFENGYVKDSFVQAVLDREEVFPTGLQVSGGGIAIPHADSEHVKTSTLGIATLKNPVDFRAMAEPDKIIPAEVVMMLAVADAKKVVLVLRKVIFLLENADAIQALKAAESAAAIKKIILDHIQSLQDKVKDDSMDH